MPYIKVEYPSKTYSLYVDDQHLHIWERVRLIDGDHAANHLARLWVGAKRTSRVRGRSQEQAAPKKEVCHNRACFSCGMQDCNLRVCEEK